MNSNKQNINPNLQSNSNSFFRHKNSVQPRVSGFKVQEKDWRKKIMQPSLRQSEIDSKLSNMLYSQNRGKQSLPTYQSQDKMISSFVSAGNLTLQKYVQQMAQSSPQRAVTKGELLEIANLVKILVISGFSRMEIMSQEQLLYKIKCGLRALIDKHHMKNR